LFSYFIPQLILPILVLGAFYLLFEGGEKILEWLGYYKESYSKLKINKMNNENKKIKGAIKTDFVLSAEIMSIASNENLNSPIIDQFLILLLISVLLTVVVYGLVFLIVRSDDFAIYLIEEQTSLILQRFGLFLIKIIPYLLKLLSIIGTFAMIFIGGEIIFNAIQNYFQIYLVNLNLFFKFGVVPIYLCVGLILSIITNLVFFLVRRLNFF
jgi:predicted DNA repair protein MutK